MRAEATPLQITLHGDPATVAQLVAALAGVLAPPAAPEQLYVGVDEASAKTGIARSRLYRWIRAGKLPNHGGPGSILLSLAEVRGVVE
jgi:hypothetical protein